MVTHKCNKEREIGIMTTKINTIEKDVKEIKNILMDFPEKIEQKYATKSEVNGIKKILYIIFGSVIAIVLGFLSWLVQKMIEKGVLI
jgi:hypothetical protein